MGTTYGYCRVSTPRQKLDRQIDNIKALAPDAFIISEKYTGTTQARPEWQRLMKRVREGDTIIFDEVSRMSRTATEGFEDYKTLYTAGVSLIFCKQRHLDTDCFRQTMEQGITLTGTDVDLILDGINQYMMRLAERQIQIAFEQSESEVDLLHKRISEGLRQAREDGKQVGREKGSTYQTKKSLAAKEVIRKHSKDFGGSLTDVEVIKLAGISKNSYYKYKKELLEECAALR
jgi:DNA invertase Pin-like site-specific DNA recombinase